MKLYISTVDRTRDTSGRSVPSGRNFLSDTLRHLDHSAWLGRVHLFFNSPWTGYAGTSPPYVDKVPIGEREYATLDGQGPHYRASYNYWRILSHRSDACVVMEDDVRVADNWYAMLVYTVDEIERRHGQYVLALYSCYPESVHSPGYSWSYPVEKFYGTQGMYYPESVRSRLEDYLLEHGVRRFREPYDLAIKRFCRENGVPLFACRRSLLQHGAPDHGTGLGGRHQTSTFQPRVEHPPATSVHRANPGLLAQSGSRYRITSVGAGGPILCNSTAALIWSLCDGERTQGEIAEELSREFSRDSAEMMGDVGDFLSDLEARSVLRKERERPRIRSAKLSGRVRRFCGCRFIGGLGNQLFQIAATLSVAVRHGLIPLFTEWEHRDAFEHELVYVDSLPADGWVYAEPGFPYAEPPARPGIILDGFFQSARYFEEATVRRFLTPDSTILDTLHQRHRDLLACDPVSLHVRRGDYLSMPGRHPVLPVDYYRDAMAHFDQGRMFLVFSDDLAWCRANLPFDNLFFVEGQSPVEDMFTMSLCRDHIIANSTFSWWGAWLDPDPDKTVVAPARWFGEQASQLDTRDLIPEEWIRIPE